MRFSTIVAALVPVAFVSAETFTVIVGGNSSLTYEPSSVTAAAGDTIAFQFQSKNHTVTQSSFASPCTNLTTGGIDSGFWAVATGATEFPQWSFTLNNASAPLWFYCRQTGHCGKGMVFAVNPTAEKSFAAFQAAAEASATGTTGSSASGSAGTTATGTSAGTSSTPSAGTTSGAMSLKHGGSAASLLALVGLVAGMAL